MTCSGMHWRPPHDPYTYTYDGQRPERLTPADRRYLKRRLRQMQARTDRRDDQARWPNDLPDERV